MNKQEALNFLTELRNKHSQKSEAEINFHSIPQDADTLEKYRTSKYHQYMFKEEFN